MLARSAEERAGRTLPSYFRVFVVLGKPGSIEAVTGRCLKRQVAVLLRLSLAAAPILLLARGTGTYIRYMTHAIMPDRKPPIVSFVALQGWVAALRARSQLEDVRAP